MATSDMGFLPTIKCSNCGHNVEISVMGDHVCAPIDHGRLSVRHREDIPTSLTLGLSRAAPIATIPPSPPPSAGLDAPDRLTTAMAMKTGRSGAPPRIDPTIASMSGNITHAGRAPKFDLRTPNVPTPANSIGSHLPSPLSATSAPRSPLQPSPRSQITLDNESVIDLDSVFSFPMPGNRPPARVGTPGLMVDVSTRSAAPTPSPRLGLDLVPENVQLPPSPLPPPPEESIDMGHHRSDSIASHSSYRTSLASTRYGSSTARSSTHSFSRGFRTFMDDTPPLPPAPLRTPNKSTFPRDSHLSVASLSYPSERGETYSGFDFGIPTDHSTVLHDLPEERSPDEPRNTDKYDFPLPPQDHLHPAAAEASSEVSRRTSDATIESAFSITNFARALGLEEQVQKAESSTSEDESHSSPSETQSGSSMSSLPSDTSLNRHKASDPLNLSPLVEELPPRTRQTILELPGRMRSPMDEVPTIPAAFFSPDSPTDPAIGRGGLSLIAERHDAISTSQHTQQAPRIQGPQEQQESQEPQEVQEPSEPLRPLQRAATAPIPRPPTRSGTRSKGNCKGCGEIITGKSISSSDGRLTGRYHRGCFVCFECSSPFPTADFYVLNNRPYCAQHYHERNGSLCSTCHNGIEGQYLETVDRNGGQPDRRRFHPDCLQCRTCHVLLQGDYFEWNGQVYCERDARRAANAYYRPPPGPPVPSGHLGPPGRRRPTIGSSPLSQSRAYPPPDGYFPPPSPAPSSGGLRPGPRFPSGGARRFPERRTTKLMMI
ncbi:hypothetical protein N7462_002929 [Penicillium macrosclerotiorum]|uniref:uncharacterized protein n=1 Tax=Penicillium macrosclerotiorum TaxID=303699 RepID=UPI002549B046|nr:uncharacterized protein N7462_002929 [Penicillium macrosclerotiorum]KAJ5688537.1 hypothetical protein N7462_002929 [Penicillium macrosclerotiorum]